MDPVIQKAKAGDREAVAALIGRHELRVRLYAAKMAPRPDMAEDIAQKAFLEALKSLERFDPDGDFGFWIQGIVRNVARQEWERLAAKTRVERDGLAQYLESLVEEAADESEVDGVWLKPLRACIESLSARARELVNLHYGVGMSCKDVGEKTGVSADAVKMALLRIRGALRTCVKTKLQGA